MTISPTIRIVLLVTTVLVLGAAGVFLLTQRNHEQASSGKTNAANATAHHSSAVVTHHSAQAHRSAHAAATAAANPDAIPPTLAHALRYHRVVVAVLYAPGVSGEAGLVALARAGAHSAHAGFVPLDVRTEKLAESVALRFPTSFDPAVLILDHDGRLVTELDGVQQSTTVAQAVLDARR